MDMPARGIRLQERGYCRAVMLNLFINEILPHVQGESRPGQDGLQNAGYFIGRSPRLLSNDHKVCAAD